MAFLKVVIAYYASFGITVEGIISRTIGGRRPISTLGLTEDNLETPHLALVCE
jgi:hypothetical protein